MWWRPVGFITIRRSETQEKTIYTHLFYLTTLADVRVLVNNELGVMWKEVAVTHLKQYPRIFLVRL